jgi:hypothetical protein
VRYLGGAYYNCQNLTGMPVLPAESTYTYVYANYTYYNCKNLTTMPPAGTGAYYMNATFYNCTNLTGAPTCSQNTYDMTNAYRGCPNIYGNAYFISDGIGLANYCFVGRDTTRALHIYVNKASRSLQTLTSSFLTDTSAVTEWTKSDDFTYTNALFNISIHAVDDVAALIDG